MHLYYILKMVAQHCVYHCVCLLWFLPPFRWAGSTVKLETAKQPHQARQDPFSMSQLDILPCTRVLGNLWPQWTSSIWHHRPTHP